MIHTATAKTKRGIKVKSFVVKKNETATIALATLRLKTAFARIDPNFKIIGVK